MDCGKRRRGCMMGSDALRVAGIAEALVATAMGLFAAIPAVLAYNRFASRVDVFNNRYDTFVDEFSSILYRQAYALRSREKKAG